MRKAQRIVQFALAMIGMVALPQAIAETVYSWVDAAGVRHFSQDPPEDTGNPVKQIELDALPPAATDSQDRLERVREVARELEFARQQREQQRLAEQPARKTPSQPDSQPPADQPQFLPYPYAYPYPYPYGTPRPYPLPAPIPPISVQPPPPTEAPSREYRPAPPGDGRP